MWRTAALTAFAFFDLFQGALVMSCCRLLRLCSVLPHCVHEYSQIAVPLLSNLEKGAAWCQASTFLDRGEAASGVFALPTPHRTYPIFLLCRCPPSHFLVTFTSPNRPLRLLHLTQFLQFRQLRPSPFTEFRYQRIQQNQRKASYNNHGRSVHFRFEQRNGRVLRLRRVS